MGRYLVSYTVPRYKAYGHSEVVNLEATGSDFMPAIREAVSKFSGYSREDMVITSIFEIPEKPADVRMSAESLIELQRVAAARAVLAFAEKGRLVELMPFAVDVAEAIRKGEVKW